MSYGNSSPKSNSLISIPVVQPDASAPVENASIEPAIEGKWPRYATLLFILVFCGLSWAAIIAAVLLAR
jgi:hypothetical protein